MTDTLDLANLEAHPFADLFPMMTGQAFDEFVADIADKGIVTPIILYQGKILDGRNRYAAAKAAGIALDPKLHKRTFTGSEAEALDLVMSLNLQRRHLTTSQRAIAAAKIAALAPGRPSKEEAAKVGIEQAAQAMQVSAFTAKLAKRVYKTARPHIVRMVEAGELTVAAADALATLPAERQDAICTVDAAKAAAEQVRRAKRRFAKTHAATLIELLAEAADEPGARGLPNFVGALDAGALETVDAVIEKLTELREAIAETQRQPLAAA
jgi:ParB-like chromosome segregation protein Spo0J